MNCHQHIYNIAEICYQQGLQHVVLSPGSRCAPLVLAFARHEHLYVRTVSDERSAAFVALGLAQQTKKATVLVCTSGTASYNYGPAVAEAYFQGIPLLILTADRPPEWVGQQDGQTIFQSNLYGAHVKASYALLADNSEHAQWHCERTINTAIIETSKPLTGPVHVNIPLREPLYPSGSSAVVEYKQDIQIISAPNTHKILTAEEVSTLQHDWHHYPKKLIICGQLNRSMRLLKYLEKLFGQEQVPIVADVTSNLHELPFIIKHHDLFMAVKQAEHLKGLQPDLVISIGSNILSKSIKLFLRKYQAKAHWHIEDAPVFPDVFQHISKHYEVTPAYFFKVLLAPQKHTKVQKKEPSSASIDFESPINQDLASFNAQILHNYTLQWKSAKKHVKEVNQSFFPQPSFSDLEACYEVLNVLPEKSILQIGNSMPVRYVNFLGLNDNHKHVEVFANRGTSGIDGSMSTAVGAANASANRLVVLILGDMSFVYDQNGLWNNDLPSNLRIIVLNNQGGNIFRMIKGPNQLPELETYFETENKASCASIAAQHQCEFFQAHNNAELQLQLPQFIAWDQQAKSPKILEVVTDKMLNKIVLDDYKLQIKRKLGVDLQTIE